MKKVTTFLFLTTVIASSSAVADPFLSLFNPVGLEVVSDNNILIAHDNVTASVVSKFTPNSELLGSSVIEGVTGINTIGFLAEIPSTGQILDMLPDGRLLLLDPISGDTGLVLAMQSIPVDASAIVDIASGTIDAFEGLIQTQFSSFGDIAVFETDNLLDVFVTALSQAQTFPFVVRLRFVDGNFQEAKVLMSSRAEA